MFQGKRERRASPFVVVGQPLKSSDTNERTESPKIKDIFLIQYLTVLILFRVINRGIPILVLYSTYFHHRPHFCAPLSPRSPGPSGAPPPAWSGPEPLWIHPRPTRPVVPSQPPVHASRAGKPRPTVICCEVLTQISTINYLEL